MNDEIVVREGPHTAITLQRGYDGDELYFILTVKDKETGFGQSSFQTRENIEGAIGPEYAQMEHVQEFINEVV